MKQTSKQLLENKLRKMVKEVLNESDDYVIRKQLIIDIKDILESFDDDLGMGSDKMKEYTKKLMILVKKLNDLN